MKKVVGTITYEGGETVPFVAGPQAFTALEAYARRQEFELGGGQNAVTSILYLAYSALHIAEGFDVWLGSVDDFDVPDAEGLEVPPTLPAAQTG